MATSVSAPMSRWPGLQDLRHDVPASLVVFLVALPLSLGIAIASGAPLMAGLIAAVAGGVVAGAVGGSPLQVSGPAAGTVTVVAGLISQIGWQATCLVTIGAGVLQILFGVSRIARAALAIAPVVVHAMLAGIGVTIALQQIHVLLGATSQSSAWANLRALPQSLAAQHGPDVLVGALVIAILLCWPRLPARVRTVPAALVAIVAATALASALQLPVERITLAGSFFDAITLPNIGAASASGWGPVLLGAVTIALIASVESLLSAVGVDKLHTGVRTDFDRELIGQGAANTVSGFLGGLPITGVIVRSSTNVAAGARTRMSAVLHGVWVLVFASLFTNLVQLIPKAALAGLLVVIGIQLIKLAHIKLAHRTGDLSIYVITMTAVVFLNLLEGVGIGLTVAVAVLAARVLRTHMQAHPFGTPASRQWQVSLEGTLSFLSLPRLTKTLRTVPAQAHVTLAVSADYIDHAVAETIADWRHAHEATGGTVMILDPSNTRLNETHTKAPQRQPITRAISAAPRRSWRPGTGASVIEGITEYNRTGAQVLHPHITELSDTQHPDAMFLTCVDSRIVPNVITTSGPGDLFTIRNVGNLVPTDPTDGSVEAALDFAVNELGVSSVVVCGHTSCDAIATLLVDAQDSAVSRWLGYAHESLVAYRDHHPARASAQARGFNAADQLAVVNVAIQLQRLHAHPALSAAVDAGTICISGTFLDINAAHMYQVDHNGILTPHAATQPHKR
ncbi:SulP family inorganic anion transporter [Mycobacteroides chelonae]|uniref:SulP family inorganic anion transporter n=1 Tax=Mycobacteroides chelonae TaxID=1774 RepID=UPI0009947C95|nr:bifunctional SulP family inorganic anion transporter/carbonic anhydrase [Mycobacteroides chelonae]